MGYMFWVTLLLCFAFDGWVRFVGEYLSEVLMAFECESVVAFQIGLKFALHLTHHG